MSNRSFSCMCHQALVCFGAMLMVFGFAAAAAHAEEPPSSAQKSEPEDTAKTNVVSEPTLGSLYTKARNASVLSESELSSGRGLPSAVSSVPGVFLQETNVGAGSPLFRGRVGIENAVRVDGLRYGNASFRTGPNQYLNVLDSQSFEAGMAVLGAGGTQFGVGATGGALLLRTFQGRDSSWGRVIGTGRTGDRALGLSAVGGVGGDAGYGFIGASLLNAGELRQAGESVAAGTGYRRSGGHFGAGVNLGDTETLIPSPQKNSVES